MILLRTFIPTIPFMGNATKNKTKAMNQIVKNDLEENSGNKYSDEFKRELDRRISEHLQGISKPISAEESKRRIWQILRDGK